ncbi:MAG: FGGY-family carbohydrate kinase, partial [Deltaproteobacteria bacterium]|nr:FGGY-family carbohydrate kinase [Deltaproteobacteria bacterium]
DLRSSQEARRLSQDRGPELFARTGHWPSPIRFLPRLMWFQKHRPAILAKVRWALGLGDWLNFRLTRRLTIELSTLGETSLWDQARGAPLSDVLSRLNLPPDLLPAPVQAGTDLGPLAQPAARALGLSPRTRVVVCGGDSPCGLLAGGGTRPGRTAVVAGTSAPVMRVVREFKTDPQFDLSTAPHLLAQMWTLEGNSQRGGKTLDWYMANYFNPLTGQKGDRAMARFEGLISRVEPGAGGLRAFLGPVVGRLNRFQGPLKSTLLGLPTLDYSGQGVFLLGRAVLENIALAIAGNLNNLDRLDPSGTSPVGLTGGLIRSRLFRRILAAVLNRPLKVTPFTEGSAHGALLLCQAGLGRYAGPEEAASDLLGPPETIDPEPDLARRYEDIAADWLAKYEQLAALDDPWPGE